MAVETEVVQSRFELEGNQALNELGKLEMKASSVKNEMQSLQRFTDEYVAKSKELNKVEKAFNKVSNELENLKQQGKENTEEFQKLSLKSNDYQQKLVAAKEALKGVKKETDKWLEASKSLETVNASIATQRKELGLNGLTYKQLSKMQSELSREMKTAATYGTEAYTKLEAKLRDVNEVLAKQKQGFSLTKSAYEAMKNQIGGVAIGTIVGNGVQSAIQSVTAIIPKYIDGLKKIADQEAAVQKTTGLTDSQYRLLNQQFQQMDTRTPREELRGLAVEAGKLGKESVKDIADFVKQADVINVALGTDLGEGAVTQIGKIADIYKVEMLNIASAVNEVGASSKASEAYQVDFLTRLSGVAPTANLSAAAMLSFGATLENNGQNAELASTALNGFFIDFIKNTEAFGKQAGFAKGELSKLIADKGTNEAFVQFLEKLKSSSSGSKELLEKLEALGINGARGSNVLLTLANSTGMVRDQFAIASEAIKSTDSVMQEFNKNNNNAAGDYEKITARIAKAFTFENVNDGVKNLIGNIEKLTRTEMSTYIQREQTDLNLLVGAIKNTNDSYGTRKALIEELQAKFPDFLGNLNAETVTNEQLQAALDLVNKEYVKKIFLQQNSEQMQEFAEKEIDLQKQLFEQTKQLNKEGKQFRVERGGEVRTMAQDIQINISQTKLAINSLKKEREDFLKGQNELAKALGIDSSKPGAKPAGDVVGAPMPIGTGGDTEVKKKAADKEAKDKAKREKANADAMADLQKHLADVDQYLEENEIKRELSRSEKREKELLNLDLHYMGQITKAEEFNTLAQANANLTTEQKIAAQNDYQQRIYQLNLQWIDATAAKEEELRLAEETRKAEIQAQIDLALMDKDAREIANTRSRYEELILLAEENGLSTIAIYEAMYFEIGVLKAKHDAEKLRTETKNQKNLAQLRQAEYEGAKILYAGFKDLLMLAAEDSEAAYGIGKVLALAEIFVNQGVAISNAVASGAKAEAQTPSFGARFTAQSAAVIGGILTGISQAVKILNQKPPETKGFYMGGETGDENGKFVGRTHANEYVIPSFIRHEPAVMNATGIIESYRQNAMDAGRTSNQSGGVSSGENIQAGAAGTDMAMVVGLIQETMAVVKQNSMKKVYFVQQDFNDFNEETTKIEFLAQR
jgi:TP901 family phage tail tape measure protein